MSLCGKYPAVRFGLSFSPSASAWAPGRSNNNNKVTLRNFADHNGSALDTTALDTNIALINHHVHPSIYPQPQPTFDANGIFVSGKLLETRHAFQRFGHRPGP
jgi:hypothetical protein